MKKILAFLSFLFFITIDLQAQVPYTANNQVNSYDGIFRPGVNPGYYGSYKNDILLTNIAGGNPASGNEGVGVRTYRSSLPEFITLIYDYPTWDGIYTYYDGLGMKDNTMIVGFAHPDHADPVEYCSGIPTDMFANLYEPIFDGGLNGTPINENNYFARYMWNLLETMGDEVKFWEIWNEPGFDYTGAVGWLNPGQPGNWWENNPDPCDYKLRAPIFHFVRTLRIAYQVIKTHSPDDFVVLSGVGYESFLDAVLRNTDNPTDGSPTTDYPLGGGAYFDVMGFHSYPHFDGSMRYWDNSIGGFAYERHSDRGVEGFLEKKAIREAHLADFGYDGVTYPLKEWMITEYNVPRVAFPDPSNPNINLFGSDEGARNFIIKSYVAAMQEGLIQIHPYQIAEREPVANADDSFDHMGFFEKFEGIDYLNQNVYEQGIGYKTSTDLLFTKEYDDAQTNQMNLPQGVKGAAFKNSFGEFTYVLWARTTIDNSEVANANYSFPTSMNVGNLDKHNWDFGLTGVTQNISSQNIALTGAPIFLVPASNMPTGEITMSCPIDSVGIVLTATQQEGGTNFSWTTPTATTTCPLGGLTITQTSGQASGSFFAIGGDVITYEAKDGCGNVVECGFTIGVRSSGGGIGDQNTGCHASREGFIYLGNYKGHKYFVSIEAMTYAEGIAMADLHGSYLASIDDEGENNYLAFWNSAQAFIGLNDIAQEGGEVWESGATVGYTNFEDSSCTWCEPNTENNDAVEYHPWNGKWNWIPATDVRQILIEVPCAETLGCGCPTTNEPVCGADGNTYLNSCEAECAGVFNYLYGSCNSTATQTYFETCPTDITVTTTSIFGGEASWTEPTVFSDCANGYTLTQSAGFDNGTTFPIGTTEISYDLTSGAGCDPATNTCTFNVTVVFDGFNNSTHPLVCPSDFNLTIPAGQTEMQVNYDQPIPGDICPSTAVFVTHFSGPMSGDILSAGNYTVTYIVSDPCGNAGSCSFNITVQGGNQGGDCPDDIAGFTTLGEFGNSKYYISNDVARAVDGQAEAETHGGYLAVISSQEENDFIQQNISEMSYIGLNDEDVEGTLEWFNGEPLTYNNVNPCGFCNENSEDQDYVIMAPWDGAWSFSNFFNSRKYVMEIPCSGGGGPGINVANCSGDITVEGTFANDYMEVVTWNLPTATTDCPNGGITITQIAGMPSGSTFSPVPSGHPVVYEITDACGNVEQCLFFIYIDPADPVYTCPANITVDATSSTGAIVIYDGPTLMSYCTADLNNYEVINGLPSGSEFPIGTTTVQLSNLMLGGAAYCQYDETCTFTVTVVDPNGGGCPDDIPGFTIIGEFGDSKYYLSNDISRPADAQVVAESHGGYLAAVSSAEENNFIQQGITEMTYIGLNDFDSEGNLMWTNGEPFTYNNVNVCGFCNENSAEMDFVIMAPWNGDWSFSNFYNNRKYVMEIPCNGGSGGGSSISVTCPQDETINLGQGETEGTINHGGVQATTTCADGGLQINLTSGPSLGENVSHGSYTIVYTITDACGNSETCTFVVNVLLDNAGGCSTTFSGFTSLGEFGNSAYYLSNDVARPVDGEATANTMGGHLVTINSQAENDFIYPLINELVYIGLNDYDSENTLTWFSGEAVNFTNFDICGFCNANTAEMDFAVMHSWNGGWSWSNFFNQRKYIVEVPCTSTVQNFPISNNNLNTTIENVKPLLGKIIPNPAMDHIFTQITTAVEGEIDLQIFDARGTIVKSEKVNLFKGKNTTRIDISDLPSGFYFVKVPQAAREFSTERFVKVGE